MAADSLWEPPVCTRQTRHAQIVTESGVLVDFAIAPLLKQLWRNGFQTQYSCEGDVDVLAYVLFQRYDDAKTFMERSMAEIIAHIPDYYEKYDGARCVALSHVHFRLEPADPIDDDRDLRGVVRFNPEFRPLLTRIWKRIEP